MIDEAMNTEQVPTPEQVLVEMKENLVPKEEAAKWQNKYNELFRSVANGTFSGEDKPVKKSEAELKADYEENLKALADTSKHMGPLEQFERLLKLDDYLTSHGQRSCFAPSEGTITADIANSYQNVRDLLESTIAQADGSDEVAVAYIGNHLTDPAGAAIRSRLR